MPPKKATAAASAKAAPKTRAPSTRKTTTAPATADATETKAPKKAAATKAAATKAAATKAAAAKVAAPKKTTAARKTQKATEESDKENAGAQAKKIAAAKRKREAEEEEEEEEEEEPADAMDIDEPEERAPKRTKTDHHLAAQAAATKTAPAKKAAAVPKKPKAATGPKRGAKKAINEVPKQVMDIFVFGEGSSGELGLGSVKYEGKKPIDVKRPRINHQLEGVVQVSCGGMHAAVLTKDNKILTWGVNDQAALGRNTDWEGGLRDVDDEDSDNDDDDDTGLNPRESNPAEIDTSTVPEGTEWAQIVTSDSATFALTTTGEVWGWGTFRSNEGILGFRKDVKIQKTPAHIPELSKIKQLAAGANHVLALDDKNKVYAWGSGQQAQLARRLLDRADQAALFPGGIGTLPGRAKAAKLVCGSYHSFILDEKKRVIGWGLNNYAELGIADEAGSDGGNVLKPHLIPALGEGKVVDIAAGAHHSLACTTDGQLLTWGRIDGHQVGQPDSVYDQDNTIWDEHNKPRILLVPTSVAGVENIVKVAAGTDHSFAITEDGKVYSWGFSANYQTGQGTMEDIKVPTLIDNTAIRDRKIIWAGAGGQYSILAAEAEE
ncbi:putative regulator of chromosome condensation protein [Echria macrotheca]|uniref:Regulator of chromosome condensation protein n=1 Tax=Echria macrotheca TaxID=438768 RepID=A0AAJ0BA01_9PEZI|nr:putative regulator of chromosome condensation protein [Echria macrotheca]